MVINAFETVSIPTFVPADGEGPFAFRDAPYKVGKIHVSAPHMYAMILESLALKPDLSLLTVGSGSGYFCALSSIIIGPTGLIHGVERDADVVEHANRSTQKFVREYPNPDALGSVYFAQGDAYSLNEADNMKYDRIYVAAGAREEDILQFRALLSVNGIMIGPFDDVLVKVTRVDEQEFQTENLCDVGFASLIHEPPPDLVTRVRLPIPLWTPESRLRFCGQFNSAATSLLILQRRQFPEGGVFAALPLSVLLVILSMCSRDWFSPAVEKCQQCGALAPFKCTNCKIVKYCSRKCQRVDWPTHKEKCKIQRIS